MDESRSILFVRTAVEPGAVRRPSTRYRADIVKNTANFFNRDERRLTARKDTIVSFSYPFDQKVNEKRSFGHYRLRKSRTSLPTRRNTPQRQIGQSSPEKNPYARPPLKATCQKRYISVYIGVKRITRIYCTLILIPPFIKHLRIRKHIWPFICFPWRFYSTQ